MSKKEELIQWIPVSERLPAENVEVLMCYQSKYEPAQKTTLATLEKNLDSEGFDWWVDGGCDDVGSVMYWAEKPRGPSQLRIEEQCLRNYHSISLNDMVRVKLTDHGRSIYRQRCEELKELLPLDSTWKPTPIREDKDGWSDWVLWELFEIFGEHITLCSENCFELEIQFAVDIN